MDTLDLRIATPYAAVLAGLALSCLPAAAQVTYTYTGNHFTEILGGAGDLTTSDHLSATMQLTNPLPANQTCIDPTTRAGFTLSMTDGENGTGTWPGISVGAVTGFVSVSTDASGAITKPWAIRLNYIDTSSKARTLDSLNDSARTCGFFTNVGDDTLPTTGGPSEAFVFTAGVWSSPTPTILLTMLKTQFQTGIINDVGTSFADQLQQILNDIAANNGLACSDLQSFVAHVNAQTGKKITTQQAATILFIASQVATQLGCPN